jgi:hypothetical protein
LDNIRNAENRSQQVMRGNSRVADRVNRSAGDYRDHYRQGIIDRHGFFDSCRGDHWGYFDHFWGGCHFWGFRWMLDPCYDITDWYWNPFVYYWSVDDADWDDYYYQTWYGDDWDRYPLLHRHFRRPGVFYPTVSFRDFSLGISVGPVETQIGYRTAVDDLTFQLETQLSAQLHSAVVLERSSVTIDHYQMVDSGQVVLEGVSSVGQQAYPYKAVLDPAHVDQDIVFVTTQTDGAPSAADAAKVDALNNQIVKVGGVVEDPN